MQADLVICLINDPTFEHDLVNNEIAPSYKGLNLPGRRIPVKSDNLLERI